MAFFTPWKLSSQKLGFFLVTFGFIWGMMLLHFTIQQRTQPESSSMLREQILDLSKRYIKALAEENRNVVDGPYAGVMTAYDLKKTLAVLLDNILQRIGKLESKVDNLVNGTGANSTNSTTAVPSLVSLEKINAEIRTDFNNLYSMMKKHEEFRWMRLRIRRMADAWIQAIKSLAEKQNLEKRKRKKILVHLGLLTKESGFKIAETAFSGGPLGELVQWSDLITSLYLLGHDIRISASLAELKEIMKKVVGNRSGCPTVGDRIVELIYIDIVGLAQFKKTLGPSWVHYQCMLRVLDSFGTEPEFNHASYAQSKGHKTPWGKWNLNPQQFYTMFPHTPDNSFLGFVVEQHLNSSDIHHINEIKRQNQSLVYGKVDSFWKIEPYMPYEFTCEGLLQRINAFIEKQDFCHGQVMWPPLSALQVKLAEPGQSCKQVCQESQLICEPSFFQHLNKEKDLLKYKVTCQSSELYKDILVPSFYPKSKHCVFQGDLLLFSCAGAHPTHQRICPCRDFIKGQVALCKDCL
ncbi:Mgat5 [Phodopus roborovskii]|uniref:alpha-1,6-mannosyl-glycoprotein 6-beta-N-acetylglucosaminyltransferase n=1 Tax=Phodopus roborovskii TaxID=109678 RepID=A0AAV0A4W5_PHORO|nr:Mgat5 [Phodopus roborovskii]